MRDATLQWLRNKLLRERCQYSRGAFPQSAIFSWLAAFACLSAVANVRKSEADYKQLFASVTFAITGVVMNTLKAGVHARQGGP